ncbi:hypothetical protein BDW22DRAFT_1426782 [Trametopsis cervina]|nr:hypothetical protein BDW22DRAFT_1426782 [Trametopsis cervina]
MLQLPAFPRHGILLNPSPTTSPYNHPTSLPGTPHLISSLSSLSSSASSSSPHNSEADHYFLTSSSPRNVASGSRNGSLAPSTTATASAASTVASRESAKARRSSLSSAPHPRRIQIRFAPLPEPRRDNQDLPDVFYDDEAENLSSLPLSSSLETPRASTTNISSRNMSLLFSGAPVPSEAPADASTPTTSSAAVTAPAPASSSHYSQVVPVHVASSTSGSERYDSDTDLTTPQSPPVVLSSSSSFIERYPYPQSCPESPIGRRVDLPKDNLKWTKKLLKPLLGPLAKKPEDVLTLGLNQLVRSTTRDSDAASSGATTPLRSRSRERAESVSGNSEKDVDFGVPLSRSTSDNTATKKPKKKSLFASLMGSDSSSGDAELWRTQSATADIRRTRSRESTIANENLRRTRSNSTGVTPGQPRQRKQLKMLNGRVYGAKRNMNGVNLFASARSEDPQFVEWGYGGMGSVKSAASVGNNKYSRVQGSAALGSSNDDDDGGGMSWVKKRKEERERAKLEAAEKAALEAAAAGANAETQEDAGDASEADKTPNEVADTHPATIIEVVAEETEGEEKSGVTPLATAESAEHVTTAVTVPAPSPRHHSIGLGHHPHGHAGRLSIERAPSYASRHSLPRTPERRGSADTARAVSPTPQSALLEAQMVGEMDDVREEEEGKEHARERRESQSSAGTASEDDEDADNEESPKEDEEDDYVNEDRTRKTAVGAGVEKISRHKSTHSQDVTTPGA